MRIRIPASAAAAVTLLIAAPALADDDRAVDSMHFEFDFSSIASDTKDSTSAGTLGADLIATIPIGSYFGASIAGHYAKSTVRTRDILEDETGTLPGSKPSCNLDSYGGTASLFFRLPKYGRIGGAYGTGNLSPDCDGDSLFPATDKDKLGTDSYRYFAEAYLWDFTIGGSFTSTKLEDAPELESTRIHASWYPIDSLKIELAGSDLYEENTYGILLEHQPEMLGDGFSVQLGYSITEEDPKTDTFRIGLSYFFGAKVPLKIRDRQFR